jgi:hypothetical protein
MYDVNAEYTHCHVFGFRSGSAAVFNLHFLTSGGGEVWSSRERVRVTTDFKPCQKMLGGNSKFWGGAEFAQETSGLITVLPTFDRHN